MRLSCRLYERSEDIDLTALTAVVAGVEGVIGAAQMVPASPVAIMSSGGKYSVRLGRMRR